MLRALRDPQFIELLDLLKNSAVPVRTAANYPNSFPRNAKDCLRQTTLSSRDFAWRLNRDFRRRQIYGHGRMIGNAVCNRFVQFAHRDGEMRSEPVALLRAPRVGDEGLDEDPVELELAYETTVVASEGVRRNEAFSASLVAVSKSSPLRRTRAIRLATEVECMAISKPELLQSLEQGLLRLSHKIGR